jgi:hypothetical protein
MRERDEATGEEERMKANQSLERFSIHIWIWRMARVFSFRETPTPFIRPKEKATQNSETLEKKYHS